MVQQVGRSEELQLSGQLRGLKGQRQRAVNHLPRTSGINIFAIVRRVPVPTRHLRKLPDTYTGSELGYRRGALIFVTGCRGRHCHTGHGQACPLL